MIDQTNRPELAGPTCGDALILLRRALEILDFAECPVHIGAHVDLAMARLQEWLLAVDLLGIDVSAPGRELASAA